jgi:hypothetical protein
VEYLLNRYLVKMRGGRATQEQHLRKAIPFDPTAGSRSNFYKSFWRQFFVEYLWNRYLVKMRGGQA